MNYRDFDLGDWIGYISGVIEDETTLDGNEMRDLVWFLTTLKQEPCEDTMAIHTQGLDEGIRCAMCTNSMKSDSGCDGGCVVNEAMYKEVMNTIGNHIVASVTPTRKKGKWIPRKAKYDNAVPVYECSICHKNNGFDDDNFCPNCGSFMRGEED